MSSTSEDPYARAKWLASAGRYADAAHVLQADLRRPLNQDEALLLATCLYKSGERTAAQSLWRDMGTPDLADISFKAPAATQKPFVAKTLGVEPGSNLDYERMQTGVRVLKEAGIDCSAAPLVDDAGICRVEVDVARQARPWESTLKMALWGIGSAVIEDIRFELPDFNGRGSSIGVHGRWIEGRSMIEGRIGFITATPVIARHTLRARFDDRHFAKELFAEDDVSRSILDWETSLPVSPRADLIFTLGRLERNSGVEEVDEGRGSIFAYGGAGARFTDSSSTGRVRANGEIRATHYSNRDGSASSFTRLDAGLWLSAAVSTSTNLSFATQLQAVSSGAPPEELVMAGVGRGRDNSLPLRGHPLFTGGRIGLAPTGHLGIIFQETLSRRLYTKGSISLWGEAVADQARLWDRIDPRKDNGGFIFDGGVAVKALLGDDYAVSLRRGYSFTDHTGVWSLSLGRQF